MPIDILLSIVGGALGGAIVLVVLRKFVTRNQDVQLAHFRSSLETLQSTCAGLAAEVRTKRKPSDAVSDDDLDEYDTRDWAV